MELVALMMLSSAETMVLLIKDKFKDEIEGREMIERKVKDLVDSQWNRKECCKHEVVKR